MPETRGSPVVILEPVTVNPPLPEGFIDIDSLVEQAEADPASKQSIAEGRKAVAAQYYGDSRPLAFYRLQKGWSQKELASRLGTSQSYVARLEAGDIDPQVSTLQRLASVLEVTANVLLEALLAGGKRK